MLADQQHPTLFTFASVLSVYAREPRALGRAVGFAIGRLHDIRLSYLAMNPQGVAPGAGYASLDVWQRAKLKLHGSVALSGAWIIALTAAALAFIRVERDTAWGWVALALVTCAVGGCVTAVLGDGRQEMEKHLWMANLLLDFAVCALLAGACNGLGVQRESVGAA